MTRSVKEMGEKNSATCKKHATLFCPDHIQYVFCITVALKYYKAWKVL